MACRKDTWAMISAQCQGHRHRIVATMANTNSLNITSMISTRKDLVWVQQHRQNRSHGGTRDHLVIITITITGQRLALGKRALHATPTQYHQTISTMRPNIIDRQNSHIHRPPIILMTMVMATMDTTRHQGINTTATLRLTCTITTTVHIIIRLISRIITTRTTLTTIPHQTIQRTTANAIVPIKHTINMTRITITKLRRQGLWRKRLARTSTHGEESWRVASSLGIVMAALGSIRE